MHPLPHLTDKLSRDRGSIIASRSQQKLARSRFAMPQQTGGSQRSRPRAYIDSSRLKTLVYELSREHARLHPYLVKVGAAGGALVADPQSSVSKVKAREAWQEL